MPAIGTSFFFILLLKAAVSRDSSAPCRGHNCDLKPKHMISHSLAWSFCLNTSSYLILL
jgi:hypothetical protein